jgi:hypothetical protein
MLACSARPLPSTLLAGSLCHGMSTVEAQLLTSPHQRHRSSVSEGVAESPRDARDGTDERDAHRKVAERAQVPALDHR